MQKRFGIVALECLLDLGVTVLYATLAGILIVAVVASDGGPVSVLSAGLYASILPAAAVGLIVIEIGTRTLKEWRLRADGCRVPCGRAGVRSPR